MIESGYTSYITGLTHMAGVMSNNLSYSYIEATVFKLKDYKKNFSKFYEVDEDKIKLEKIERSSRDVFYDWFKNSEIVNNLAYLVERSLGKEKNVYMVCDNSLIDMLSGYDNGLSGFYILEEMIFVEYEKGMVCYMIGNNE